MHATGKRVRDLPITPDRLLQAADQAQFEQPARHRRRDFPREIGKDRAHESRFQHGDKQIISGIQAEDPK